MYKRLAHRGLALRISGLVVPLVLLASLFAFVPQVVPAVSVVSATTSGQTGYTENQASWKNLGPIPTSNCTSNSTPPYPICISSSGQVWSLAIAPATQNNPETIYQATSGGIWKSTNNGQSWINTTEQYGGSHGLGEAVAVSPADPNEVFASDGGLLWSTNAGSSWTQLWSAAQIWNNSPIIQIVPSYTNPNVIYYTSGHGVTEGTYNGTAWSFRPISSNGNWIALDPKNPNLMYLSSGTTNLASDYTPGVYKGIYDGSTWSFTLMAGTWWANTASSYASVSRVAVSPVNSKDIYVLLYTQNGVHAYLCYSTDAGTTWGCDSGMASIEGPDGGTSTAFAHALIVSTTSASTVAVGWGGGTNVWLNALSGSPTMETFTSDDYGFGSDTNAAPGGATYSLAYDTNGNLFVGSHGVTELTVNGTLYGLNNSALSTDEVYAPIVEQSNGAIIDAGAQGMRTDQYTQSSGWGRPFNGCVDNYYGIALDPYIQSSNQTEAFCTSGGCTGINGFDINDPNSNNNPLNNVALPMPSLQVHDQCISSNMGDLAIGGSSSTPELFMVGPRLYETPHPITNGENYYASGPTTPPVSISWTPVSTGIGAAIEPGGKITWVSVNPTNPQIMLVGNNGDNVHASAQVALSTDGGRTWRTILSIPRTSTLQEQGVLATAVSQIWQSPTLTNGLPSVILVSCSYKSQDWIGTPCLYESTNGGASFTDIVANVGTTPAQTPLSPSSSAPPMPPLSASLPTNYFSASGNDIAGACYDPVGNAIYVATSQGVYFTYLTQSVDGPYTAWARAGTGMGGKDVNYVLCTKEGKVIASTFGNGVWEMQGVTSPYGLAPTLNPVSPVSANATTLSVTGTGFVPSYGYSSPTPWPERGAQQGTSIPINTSPNYMSAPEPTAVWLNGVPLYDPTITPTTLSVSVSPASIQVGTNTLVVATPGGMAKTTFQGTLPVPLPQSNYVPVSPHRIVDTRCSETPQPTFCPSENLPSVNASLGMVTPTHPITVSVAGSTSGLIPLSATAVVLNVTAIDASSNSGYVTVSPTTTSSVSSLNVSPGHASFNLVTSKLSSTGTVQISPSVDVNIAADIEGYYTSGSGMDFTGIAPIRLVDTRCVSTPQPDYCASENLPQANASLSAIPPGGTIQVYTGSSGAGAMAVNVTVPDAKSSGYLTLYSGSSKPVTSNVNFSKAGTVANMAIVPLNTQGSFYIYNSSNQPEDVIVDEMGTFSQTGTETYSPISPLRICDTRKGTDVISGITGQCDNSGEALGVNKSMSVGGIETALMDAIGSTTSASTVAAPVAVVLNVTAVSPTSGGYLTVYPSSSARPTTSSVNFSAGTIQASQVVVDVGAAGSFNIYSSSNVNVVVDVEGFYW